MWRNQSFLIEVPLTKGDLGGLDYSDNLLSNIALTNSGIV